MGKCNSDGFLLLKISPIQDLINSFHLPVFMQNILDAQLPTLTPGTLRFQWTAGAAPLFIYILVLRMARGTLDWNKPHQTLVQQK